MKASTLVNHQIDTPSIAISPGGSILVTATAQGDVYLHRLPDGTIIRLLEQQPGFVKRISFSGDGNFLALCSTNADSPEGTTHLWYTPTWTLLGELANDKIGGGHSLAFTPDNAHLIVGHADGHARIWRLSDKTVQHEFQESSEIPVVAVDQTASIIAVGNEDVVQLWRLDKIARRWTLDGHNNWVWNMAFSPNGSYLVVTGAWGPLLLWDVRAGTLVRQLLEENYTHTVAFALNGETLACGCLDGQIRIVSIPDGKLRGAIPAHDKWIRDLQYTPDGLALISSGTDGAVKFWQDVMK